MSDKVEQVKQTLKGIFPSYINIFPETWWDRATKQIDTLYPERAGETCPECSGFGEVSVAGCSGTSNIKCLVCRGTGKVAQPVPPVPDLMLTAHEMHLINNEMPSTSKYGEVFVEIAKAQLKACQDYYQPLLTALRKDWQKSDHEIEQILGKVLGYPAYKDDPKNFPNATETNGVCVGDNVPASLAMEIAKRLTANGAKIRELEKALTVIEAICGDDWCECKSMGKKPSIGIKKLEKCYMYAHSVLPTICHESHDGWRKDLDIASQQLKSEGKGK